MNTYTITYWPPGNGTSVTATVQAADFMLDGASVIFINTQQHAVFAVPQALSPVITQTASG